MRPRTPSGNAYKYYVLGVLLLVGTLSWTDRQLFAIMLEAVRRDLTLSDVQLGLVGGTAFGLFYAAASLPIAWLADRTNRCNILALAVGMWSVMTALCGAAVGFLSLFACRVGVGIGEAGGAAPAQSLVSDLFPTHQRGFAMGALYAYIPLGYVLSYAVGGWLTETISWRAAFIGFGMAGVLLSVLLRLALAEPSRSLQPPAQESWRPLRTSVFAEVQGFLKVPSLRHVPVAGAAHALAMSGLAIWLPAYFIRIHHLGSAKVGLALAAIMGGGGLAGTLLGGYFVDHLVRRTNDARWYAWSCAGFIATTVPFTLAVFLTRSATTALIAFVIPSILNHMILGPVFALVQGLAGAGRRAVGAAYYLFLVNLVSAGFGPLIIGGFSDSLRARFDEQSLRYSLLLVIPLANAWAALHFMLAARTLRKDYPPDELPLAQ